MPLQLYVCLSTTLIKIHRSSNINPELCNAFVQCASFILMKNNRASRKTASINSEAGNKSHNRIFKHYRTVLLKNKKYFVCKSSILTCEWVCVCVCVSTRGIAAILFTIAVWLSICILLCMLQTQFMANLKCLADCPDNTHGLTLDEEWQRRKHKKVRVPIFTI